MSNSFVFSGRLLRVYETQTIPTASGKEFFKREFDVVVDTQYPYHRRFQCVQDKCDLLDKLKINDMVDVHFNAEGREYHKSKIEKKDDGTEVKVYLYDELGNPTMAVFNTDTCWKIEVTGHDSAYEPAPTKSNDYAKPEHKVAAKVEPAPAPIQAEDDDLPF
jgi:hypothetical protein